MSETVIQLNFLLATGGVLLIFGTLAVLGDLFLNQWLKPLVRQWGIVVAFLFTSASTLMTLLYSEVFGFVPCGLCWLQRVALYPQVVLTLMAVIYKEKVAARYGLALSVPGLVVSLYQHYLQMGGTEIVTCPLSGGDCGKRFMFEYGFVTFPLLSAILFVFLIVLYLYILNIDKNEL